MFLFYNFCIYFIYASFAPSSVNNAKRVLFLIPYYCRHWFIHVIITFLIFIYLLWFTYGALILKNVKEIRYKSFFSQYHRSKSGWFNPHSYQSPFSPRRSMYVYIHSIILKCLQIQYINKYTLWFKDFVTLKQWFLTGFKF